jgi:hypothetical protein
MQRRDLLKGADAIASLSAIELSGCVLKKPFLDINSL